MASLHGVCGIGQKLTMVIIIIKQQLESAA